MLALCGWVLGGSQQGRRADPRGKAVIALRASGEGCHPCDQGGVFFLWDSSSVYCEVGTWLVRQLHCRPIPVSRYFHVSPTIRKWVRTTVGGHVVV